MTNQWQVQKIRDTRSSDITTQSNRSHVLQHYKKEDVVIEFYINMYTNTFTSIQYPNGHTIDVHHTEINIYPIMHHAAGIQ